MILCKKKHAKAIDKAIFPGTQGGPLMHTIAAKAVALKEALEPEFTLYQRRILENAKAMENAFSRQNVRMVSGGTDNHMLLLDLSETGRNGKEMEALLGKAYITVNKNTIPNETLSPFVTSGVRIGTPAVTTRGMNAEDMKSIAGWIARILSEGEACIDAVREEVLALCGRYPLYENEVSW
jgi:glycine hydroxymethyltransferase